MTQTRQRIATCEKNGKRYHAMVVHGERGLFEFYSMCDAGLIRVLSHGEENVYFEFTDDAGFVQAGFCKCL